MTLATLKTGLNAETDAAMDAAYALGVSSGGSETDFTENTWAVVNGGKILDNFSTGHPEVFTGSNAQAAATSRTAWWQNQGYAGAAAKELKYVD